MRSFAGGAAILSLGFLAIGGCIPGGESHQTADHQGEGDHESAAEKAGHGEGEGGEEGHQHKIVVTSPVRKDVISTQRYVSQIHSCQHIELRALEGGYLEKICVKEGQAVKKGDLLFQILPTLHQARLDTEIAEANHVEIELNNLHALLEKKYISDQAIALKKAELAKMKAKVDLVRAEMGFTKITAPFDGIVDRQLCQQGSLISEGDVLTTFSDNSKMWVYFNVPEAQYLEYVAELQPEAPKQPEDSSIQQVKLVEEDKATVSEQADGINESESDGEKAVGPPGFQRFRIELELANGKTFSQPGKIGAIEADFNNTTGNIAFRADFPNPAGVLRNGQTGTILVHSTLANVVVIPQRATFAILAKRYAYVVDKNNVVHQRDITIEAAQDDIFVVSEGLDKDDKIILEGIRQVRDGDKIKYEYLEPEKALSNLKHHAE